MSDSGKPSAAVDLAWLLPICLAVRLAYALSLESLPALTPSDGYIEIASNIADGKGFGPSQFRPTYVRTPCYPLYLSMFIDDGRARYLGIVLGQIAISVVNCGALYWLARLVIGTHVARIAGLLFALSPSSVIFCTLIFPETLHVLVVTLAALAAAYLYRNPAIVSAAAFGVFWGLAGLTRPEATFLLPLMLLPFAFNSLGKWKLCLTRLGAAGFACVLIMLPWIARNALVYGAFVLHIPANGMSLYQSTYPHPPMYGRLWHHDGGKLINVTTTEEYQEIVRPYWAAGSPNRDPTHWNEIVTDSERELLEVDRKLSNRALHNLVAYPTVQMKNAAFHCWDLWRRPAAWGYTPFTQFNWPWFLGYLVFMTAAFLGTVFLVDDRGIRGAVGSWLAFVVGHGLLFLLMYTEPRYQMSALPFICIFTGSFFARVHRVIRTNVAARDRLIL